MIDFACKQFDLDEVIKCSLGLTKTEFKIMKYFLKEINRECTTISISKELNLNLTTIQKAAKKLSDKKIIIRHQKNLKKGGYIYTYEYNSKQDTRKIIKGIIKNWFKKVEERIDKW